MTRLAASRPRNLVTARLDILEVKILCWLSDPVEVELGMSTNLGRRARPRARFNTAQTAAASSSAVCWGKDTQVVVLVPVQCLGDVTPTCTSKAKAGQGSRWRLVCFAKDPAFWLHLDIVIPRVVTKKFAQEVARKASCHILSVSMSCVTCSDSFEGTLDKLYN